jgi:hypothetical protein
MVAYDRRLIATWQGELALRLTTMSRCIQCGGYTNKVHRTLLQRLPYASIRACGDCDFRTRRLRRWFAFVQFAFTPSTACPRCGTDQVQRINDKDGFGPLSAHPASVLQRIFGGHAWRCSLCRVRYYDWRNARVRSSPALRANRTQNTRDPAENMSAHFAEPRLSGRTAHHGK